MIWATTTNISITEALRNWTPIKTFAGTFDGQMNTISGVYLNTSLQKAGLFAEQSGTVSNFYLKNSYFHEEVEYRLNFDNSDGKLENCIRFRKSSDGSLVPYIVVKYGDLLDSGRCLKHTYTPKKLTTYSMNIFPICKGIQ